MVLSTFHGLRIVAGSYERLLFGYALDLSSSSSSSENKPYTPLFAFVAHAGAIKSVSIASKKNGHSWLASGGTDESIQLFDLKKLKNMGELGMHQGTLTWTGFYSTSHFFSCDDKGTIWITRTKDWENLKVLKGQ
ncbi:hypothetical protein HMI56_000620, partial [Coelomomyces lativittatus]